VGGASEIIREGQNGWLIDPLDEEDIYLKLEQLLVLAPGERDKVTASARESTLKAFGPVEYLKQLDDYYKTLMA
jgi:glycosyltransferase involved in cell wall biosynthesis